MPLASLPCVFMRGGTSKGLIFKIRDLPAAREDWAPIFLAAMGSPDPYERQLDGMGGGVSSLSKICIVGPSSHPDAEVDYTFAQISVTGTGVDYSGNCGNMSSAIGPFALEEGMVPLPDGNRTSVRIHNTNTGKIIHSHFELDGGRAAVSGDFVLDGVAGQSAPIRLDFIDPGGAKTGRLLPTGRPVDRIEVPGLGPVDASLVDAANPFVFVRARDLGLEGDELPDRIGKDGELMDRLEAIRRAASVMMGLTADLKEAAEMIALPKISMLSPMRASATISGRDLEAGEADILSRTISVGQPHKAIPLTGALCLAAAVRTPGTLAHQAAGKTADPDKIVIAHPSGTIEVDAEVSEAEGKLHLPRASVFRSARRLFDGRVHFKPA